MHVHGITITMQDGFPCHQSKVATEFLKKNPDLSVGIAREPPRSGFNREPVDWYEG